MLIGGIPFGVTDWAEVPATEHPGETGTATWRTRQFGDVRVRMVEYSPGYLADHWCLKGHVLLVLAGTLTTELAGGRTVTLRTGDGYQVGDDTEAHRSSTSTGARLFIVDQPRKGRAAMEAPEVARAVAAATSTATSLGLAVDDAISLHNSNKLTLRLLPCDVLARVAPVAEQIAQFEIDLARRLIESGCPVAALEPRVAPRPYERDGFVITLWTYYEPATPREVSPADYAQALARLHAGMRTLDFPAPHFTDRVEEAQQIVASRDQSPALADADRDFLGDTLRSLRRSIVGRGRAEQLLHGEPHPGNLLTTNGGLLFVDLETCCRGPVEFDIAHAPDEIGAHYPDIDQDLLSECRLLKLAMITAWRWDRGDQFPDGRRLGTEGLGELRLLANA